MSDPHEQLPKLGDNAITDQRAVLAVKEQFLAAGGHVLEEIQPDYGRDHRLIFRDRGRVRGYSTSLQIKGTRTKDTETYRAFTWRVSVSNLCYLNEDPAPAYYLFHNCESGRTYFREAHEIVWYLEMCQRGWMNQETVTLTVLAKNLLRPDAIEHMAAEANAWAMERETTRQTIEYLEGQVARVAHVEELPVADPSHLVGGCRLSGGFRVRRPADTVDLLRVQAILGQATELCRTYRERARGLTPRHLWSPTSHGLLDLTSLTARLQTLKARYQDALAEHEDTVRRGAPQPLQDREWDPPERDVLPHLDLAGMDAGAARDRLLLRFERLGIEASPTDEDEWDLGVAIGRSTGLISLAGFDRTIPRDRIERVRRDLERRGDCAAAILIQLCQLDGLGMQRWVRPATEPEPKIPIGTASPLVEGLEADLLRDFLRGDPWPGVGIAASTLPEGFSLAMPTWAPPMSQQASLYQQAVVRKHARYALDAVCGGDSVSFIYIWGLDRVELHSVRSVADLILYIQKGPDAFADAGGQALFARR